MTQCPCGSQQSLQDCCNPFISGKILADTPEKLMRSRYTAYTLNDIDYIVRTMKAPANLNFDAKEAKAWAAHSKWEGLEIINASQDKDSGTVEFIAHFTENSQQYTLHEISDFRRENGEWFYIDGKHPVKTPIRFHKMARNDPCTCGSQIKYKKCCGKNA